MVDSWLQDSARSSDWDKLQPGTKVTVVKLAPDGRQAASYPGEVVAQREADDWVIVRATWTYQEIRTAGLSFVPGDVLFESFSPKYPFNAFAVFSPSGEFRGWYANVTRPAFLDPITSDGMNPTVVWHDLYLDLVGLPDNSFAMVDEDELHAAQLNTRDPELLNMILKGARELRRRFKRQRPPFFSKGEFTALLHAPLHERAGH